MFKVHLLNNEIGNPYYNVFKLLKPHYKNILAVLVSVSISLALLAPSVAVTAQYRIIKLSRKSNSGNVLLTRLKAANLKTVV